MKEIEKKALLRRKDKKNNRIQGDRILTIDINPSLDESKKTQVKFHKRDPSTYSLRYSNSNSKMLSSSCQSSTINEFMKFRYH